MFSQAMVNVGVLALQGDVIEHLKMVEACGACPVEVRTAATLEMVDGLIIPGGESPTIGKLLGRSGLDTAIQRRVREGMPVYGTCAGLILLAREATGGKPPLLGLMNITVARNNYGRQRESFEAVLEVPAVDPRPFRVAFIRAPVITTVGSDVEVLATYDGHPVLVRQATLLAGTFHPEIMRYEGIHRYFCTLAAEARVVKVR